MFVIKAFRNFSEIMDLYEADQVLVIKRGSICNGKQTEPNGVAAIVSFLVPQKGSGTAIEYRLVCGFDSEITESHYRSMAGIYERIIIEDSNGGREVIHAILEKPEKPSVAGG